MTDENTTKTNTYYILTDENTTKIWVAYRSTGVLIKLFLVATIQRFCATLENLCTLHVRTLINQQVTVEPIHAQGLIVATP